VHHGRACFHRKGAGCQRNSTKGRPKLPGLARRIRACSGSDRRGQPFFLSDLGGALTWPAHTALRRRVATRPFIWIPPMLQPGVRKHGIDSSRGHIMLTLHTAPDFIYPLQIHTRRIRQTASPVGSGAMPVRGSGGRTRGL